VTIGRHLRSEPPSIGAARPDLADWDAPLRVALAKDPEQRFATCRQFVAALSGTDPDAGTAGSIAAARLPTRAAPRPQAAPPARTPPAQDPPASPARWSLVAAGTALGLRAGAVVLGAAESGSPRAAAPAPATQTTTSTQITTSTQTTTSTSTTTVTRTPAATTVTETVTAPPAPPSAAGRSSAAVADPLPASTGRWNAAANPVTTLGWRDCIRRYPWSSCLEAARVIAGAPPGSTAVLALDGVWMVPQVVGYGDYRAAVGHGGRCSWSGNDVHGRIVDSGVQAGTGTPVAVTVTPTMATVQTFGCTPWFRVAPAR
jgi:serine/threonine-protein kinase